MLLRNDTVPDLLRIVDFAQDNIKDWVILDSGATSNFLVTEAPVADIVSAMNPFTVTISDDLKVQSTRDCKLATLKLPAQARIAHIVPGLVLHSLISISSD